MIDIHDTAKFARFFITRLFAGVMGVSWQCAGCVVAPPGAGRGALVSDSPDQDFGLRQDGGGRVEGPGGRARRTGRREGWRGGTEGGSASVAFKASARE